MEDNTIQGERIMTRLQKYHKKDVTSITPSSIAPPERTSRRSKPPAKSKIKIKNKKSTAAKGWVVTILLAIIISLALRIFVFEIVKVDGDSMMPTLDSEQRVVVDKVSRYFNLPYRGQIVVTKYPNMAGYYVKRLIGLPGDIIEIKHNAIYVNGSPLQENYLPAGLTIADMQQTTVPVGTIFVVGDNRSVSLDSRSPLIGPVSTENLLGNALLVIWPVNEIHTLL
jgi:signal peptidase I